MKINCAIVIKETSLINLIKKDLELFNDFKIIGEADHAIEAIKLIETNKIDLLIMDTDLPDLKGIGLLYSLVNPPKTIVFSSEIEYAIDCYELNVVDYLRTPFSTQRFIKALNKFKTVYLNEKIHYRSSKLPYLDNSETLKLEINSKIYNLKLKEIIYIESMREYIKIHFDNDSSLVLKYVLTKLEEQLPKKDFIRIHKSFIISISKIKVYSNKQVEIADKKIPIGSFYRKEALQVLF